MHLHNCRCFQEHLTMLLHSLRALCKAPGGAGSIWKYLEALVRTTRVSARFAYGFRTNLRFADVSKLRSLRKWDKGIDINPENDPTYTTQYKDPFLKNLLNEYYAKCTELSVMKPETIPSNNFASSRMACRCGQSSFDSYTLSSDGEEYLMPNYIAEATPRRSDSTIRLSTAARLYLNLPPESPKNWGQVNPNYHEYHSNLIEISSTFGIPHISHWLYQ